jgi:hypothetical protein
LWPIGLDSANPNPVNSRIGGERALSGVVPIGQHYATIGDLFCVRASRHSFGFQFSTMVIGGLAMSGRLLIRKR